MNKTTKSDDNAMTDKTEHAPHLSTETHGQTLLHRVEARKKEFEAMLAKSPNDPARDPSHAGAIEAALNAVKGLLTGDLKDINSQTAAELSLWLESSKHLSKMEAAHVKPQHKA